MRGQSWTMSSPSFTTAPTGNAASPHLKVLVVDDDPDSAESLAFCLQLEGRKVHYVTSGEDALALAETFAPHVALVDIFMPRVDGHALAAELRRRLGKEVVVVAVTGALKSVELSAFDFHLTKPIDFQRLDEVLSRRAQAA